MAGQMPLLTELGGIIHRVAVNIALLTERELVQSSAISSFTAPEHPGRKRCNMLSVCELAELEMRDHVNNDVASPFQIACHMAH